MIPLMFDGLMTPEALILAVIAVVIAAYLFFLEKKTKSDKNAALCDTYAVMTEELLTSVSDEEVVQAVVTNIMHKQDKRRPDVAATLGLMSRGRAAVYCVWLLCHEADKQDFDVVFKSSSRQFVEPAIDGLERIGAANTATALRAAWRMADDRSEQPLWDAVTTVFREAVASEQPLVLCVRYIRENPEEFVD